jgi:aspartyl-tRNA(Asn)/glutamyl-tRNA(Gln) amidotransferase subunit B
VQGELSGALNREGLAIVDSPISARQLGELIARVMDDTINGKAAKEVFQALWHGEGGGEDNSADAIIEAKGLKQVTDSGAIEAMIDQVIAESPAQVAQYRDAEPDKRGKMIGYFVGQVMKASRGTANPQQVNALLKEKLDALC